MGNLQRSAVLAAGLFLVAAGCTAQGRADIVFTSNVDGDNEIYVIGGDGTGQRQLTKNQSDDFEPVWSPDGKKIAFSSDRDGNREVYVINLDGTGLVNLTKNQAPDISPRWSPDGTKIAFRSFRDGNPELYVMNADGSNPVNISQSGPLEDANPQWSPDGSRLAFESFLTAQEAEIVVVGSDGKGLVNLTKSEKVKDFLPAWSPDGSRIAFVSERNRAMNVYVIGSDGTGETKVSDGPGIDSFPVWTPDGSAIIYTSTRDSVRMGIYYLDLASSTSKNISARPSDEDYDHAVAPDGSAVVFVRATGANSELYRMRLDGTDQKAVTKLGGAVYRPLWSPTYANAALPL